MLWRERVAPIHRTGAPRTPSAAGGRARPGRRGPKPNLLTLPRCETASSRLPSSARCFWPFLRPPQPRLKRRRTPGAPAQQPAEQPAATVDPGAAQAEPAQTDTTPEEPAPGDQGDSDVPQQYTDPLAGQNDQTPKQQDPAETAPAATGAQPVSASGSQLPSTGAPAGLLALGGLTLLGAGWPCGSSVATPPTRIRTAATEAAGPAPGRAGAVAWAGVPATGCRIPPCTRSASRRRPSCRRRLRRGPPRSRPRWAGTR